MAAFGVEEGEALRLAASAQIPSEHPLAEALVRKARDMGLDLTRAEGFQARPGKGVLALVEGHRVVAGNRILFAEEGISVPPEMLEKASLYEAQGRTAVLLALDGRGSAAFSISDQLKSTAQDAVLKLQKMNLSVVMITETTPRALPP